MEKFPVINLTTNIKHNALYIIILQQSSSMMHYTLYSTTVIKHNSLYIIILQQSQNTMHYTI